MNKIRLLLIALFGMTAFAACSESDGQMTITDPKPADGHTLVFYIMGNGTGLTDSMDLNILALRGIANEVISETNHIVVFYDRGDYTRLMEIVKENGRIKERVIKEYENTDNCIDTQFMADVFQLIDGTFHSDSYGVVFSSHGGGWASPEIFNEYIYENVPAAAQNAPAAEPLYCGQDGLVYMEITDMAYALSLSGVHFDYILFDACYMGSIEAAYDLRRCADYIIASPCEVLAGGFPYTQIIPMLFTEGHRLQEVCEAYVGHYQAQSGDKQSAIISLTDCSKLDALAEQVMKINIINNNTELNVAEIQAYENFNSHLFFDLEHYCHVRADGNLTDEFKAALKAAIPYSGHTDQFYTVYGPEPALVPITRSCGVSCFVWTPESAASTVAKEAHKKTAWAKATGM